MRYVPLFMLKTCRVFSHLNGASLAVFESTGRSGLSLDLYFLLVVVIHLEWHAYSEMECKISVHVRVE